MVLSQRACLFATSHPSYLNAGLCAIFLTHVEESKEHPNEHKQVPGVKIATDPSWGSNSTHNGYLDPTKKRIFLIPKMFKLHSLS